MNEEVCVCCGNVIPEGRQVCMSCEQYAEKPQTEAYFETYIAALEYAESRADWKFFKVRPTQDGRYAAIRTEWNENGII